MDSSFLVDGKTCLCDVNKQRKSSRLLCEQLMRGNAYVSLLAKKFFQTDAVGRGSIIRIVQYSKSRTSLGIDTVG